MTNTTFLVGVSLGALLGVLGAFALAALVFGNVRTLQWQGFLPNVVRGQKHPDIPPARVLPGGWTLVGQLPHNELVWSFGRRTNQPHGKESILVGTRNLQEGAELWELQGTPDNPLITRLSQNGLTSRENLDLYGFVDFRGFVYAGTYNLSGAEVLRSTDGMAWEQVATKGFNDPANQDTIAYAVFRNGLFIGTWNDKSGGEVWKTSYGHDWKRVLKVTLPGEYVRKLLVWNDRLWAIEYRSMEVYSSPDGLTWNREQFPAIVREPGDYGFWDAAVFGGQLVLTRTNALKGGSLLALAPDGRAKVMAQGVLGDPSQQFFTLHVHETPSSSCLLLGTATTAGVSAQVWLTNNLHDFTPMVLSFRSPSYNHVNAMASWGDRILLGVGNGQQNVSSVAAGLYVSAYNPCTSVPRV